ncbi:MAG: hypothetical protein A4E53_02330 [Pelotomaculum sp. PtaB.Bin104]|nr:MAG: hypothetical protein A4E53_02330 [Pelotomaculum sp. PtaB.Bin104]
MRFIPLFEIRSLIIGIALIAGITVGVFSSSYAKGNDYSGSIFPKNASGQTYGSGMDATLDTMPDLISACGIDNTFGYVRRSDLFEELPKNPEEAVAIQLKRDREREAGIVVSQIPLYDVDGKTIIGVFNIDNEKIDTEEIDNQQLKAKEARYLKVSSSTE